MSTHSTKETIQPVTVESINETIKVVKLDTNLISDGYHTFGELYEHRIRLFIQLCKMTKALSLLDVTNKVKGIYPSVWAYVENESEQWFLLGIWKEDGKQITYHLPARFWNEVCEFAEILKDKPQWDGHSSSDILERLKQL